MKIIHFLIILSVFLLTSCACLNSYYLSDPVPYGKDSFEVYAGLSTGFYAGLDSIGYDGKVFIDDKKLNVAPMLCFGLKGGISETSTFGLSVQFPWIAAGAGFNLFYQKSLYNKESKYNAAVALNVGATFALDHYNESNPDYNEESNPAIASAYHFGISVPIAYKFTEDFRLIASVGASHTIFRAVDYDYQIDNRHSVKYSYLTYSAGLRYKKIHVEMMILHNKDQWLPMFGVAYLLSDI